MKLSDQAIGAIMMALQKSLLEQSDIVPVFKGFELSVDDNNEVVVKNPPTVKIDHGMSPTDVARAEGLA